jgi:hypothetical protein
MFCVPDTCRSCVIAGALQRNRRRCIRIRPGHQSSRRQRQLLHSADRRGRTSLVIMQPETADAQHVSIRDIYSPCFN